MTERTTTLDEWRRLYQAAIHLKDAAPWQWMEEQDVFGVQDPETGEVGFVSIMGILGEHLGLAIYLEPWALYRFWAIHNAGPITPPHFLLEVPHLHASFEDRRYLTDLDLQLIKQLGLKFRGRKAWPRFRSFQPGFCPWYLEPHEVGFLTHALEQALDVSLRFRDQPDLLMPGGDQSYLARIPLRQEGGLAWTDVAINVPPPEPRSININFSVGEWTQAKQLPKGSARLQIDVFPILSASVAESPQQRPYYPYVFLCLDVKTGVILDAQVLNPTPSLEDMYGSVPVISVRRFITTLRSLPAQVEVTNPLLYQLLQSLAQELKIKVNLVAELPALEEAKEALLDHFLVEDRR